MKPRELQTQLRAIEAALHHGRSLDEGSPERAMMARFACVLTSGLIESVVRVHLIHFTQASKPKSQIQDYVTATVNRFQNPYFKRILDFTGQFCKHWRSQLEELDHAVRSAIDSIVSNRHLIAHGRSSAISLRQVEQYLNYVKQFEIVFARLSG
jgi:hypothetical protein